MTDRTLLEDVRDVWRAFTDLSESGDIDVNCYGEAAVLARKQLNSILARVEAALASDAPEQLEDAQEKIKQLTIDLLQQTAEASKNYELGLAAGFEKGLIAAEERQAALAETSEERVERVARAICKATYYDVEPDMYESEEAFFTKDGPDAWKYFGDSDFMHQARAAIAAMGERG